MSIIYVPRTGGSVLILDTNNFPAPTVTPNATVYVRSGQGTVDVRSGVATEFVRSGQATVKVRAN